MKWRSIFDENPPVHTNVLLANKDRSFFGFHYTKEGWSLMDRVNYYGPHNVILGAYTSEAHWWVPVTEVAQPDV